MPAAGGHDRHDANPQNRLRPVTPGGGLVPTLTRSESQGVAARGGPARASPGDLPRNSNCAPRETATAPLFHGLYKRAHHCLRPQRFPVLRLASASSYHQDDGSSPRSLFNAAGCNSARVGCYAQALKNERSRGCAAKFCRGLEKGVSATFFVRPFSDGQKYRRRRTGAICASKTLKHLKSLRSQRRGNIRAPKSSNRRGHVICDRAALSANADD